MAVECQRFINLKQDSAEVKNIQLLSQLLVNMVQRQNQAVSPMFIKIAGGLLLVGTVLDGILHVTVHSGHVTAKDVTKRDIKMGSVSYLIANQHFTCSVLPKVYNQTIWLQLFCQIPSLDVTMSWLL